MKYCCLFFASILIGLNCFAAPCELAITRISPISEIPYTDRNDIKYNSKNDVVTLSPNEYEPISFVIHNKGPSTCENIELETTVIKPEDIASNNSLISTDIKLVKRWMQSAGGWKHIKTKGKAVFIPELLVNDDKIIRTDRENAKNYLKVLREGKYEYVDISDKSVSKGRTVHNIDDLNVEDSKKLLPFSIHSGDIRQVWITVDADANTKAGSYKLMFTVSTEKTFLFNIPIELSIFPISLDAPSITYSIFYRGELVNGEGSISSENKDELQFSYELRDMKQHGICCPVIYQGLDNKNLFEKNMRIRKDIFGNKYPAFLTGLSASLATTINRERHLVKKMRYLREHQDEFSISEYFLFGKDEARGKILSSQKYSWQLVKSSGLNIFATGYSGTYDKIGDYLDILVLAGKPNIEETRKFHQHGKEVFTYGYPQTGPENPLIFRKNYGLKLWQLGIDGAMPYAYQDSFQSTWNDFDHEKYRDHNFTYPTANGAIGTIAWEGFREGVDDVRYITTLENLFNDKSQDKRCSGNRKCNSLLDKTNSFISEMKKSSLSDLDQIRSRIAAHIMALESISYD